MTTHVTRARWVTAVWVPLPHWSTQSRPCHLLRPRLRAGFRVPAYYLAAFAQFPNKRLIAVGKFECNVKYYLLMFSNLLFRVPQCNRRDKFLCAFVKRLAVFRLHIACSVECCRRLYLQDGASAAAPRPARGQSDVDGSGGGTFTCQPPSRVGLEYSLWHCPLRSRWNISGDFGDLPETCERHKIEFYAICKKRKLICNMSWKMLWSFFFKQGKLNWWLIDHLCQVPATFLVRGTDEKFWSGQRAAAKNRYNWREWNITFHLGKWPRNQLHLKVVLTAEMLQTKLTYIELVLRISSRWFYFLFCVDIIADLPIFF